MTAMKTKTYTFFAVVKFLFFFIIHFASIKNISGVFLLGSHTHFLSEEMNKVHCWRREFAIKVLPALFHTSTYTAALQLFLFQSPSKVGGLAWLRDDPSRLVPASHQPASDHPPSNFLHLLQESNWTPGLLLADKTRNWL